MSSDQNPNLPDAWDESLPEDLPPVEPPSAGFIVQLFVVPMLIVAVVVGVYVAFGRLATVEQDWRQLVTDVKSENPHVKWRGALGLAQMLDDDARSGERGQQLAENREIATALASLYDELLDRPNPNVEETQQIEFLSKALGQMDVDDVAIPSLRHGLDERLDREVRKHSLIGIAMIAGRAQQADRELAAPGLVQQLISISESSAPLFRHQAAFTLGLFDAEAAHERLEVLLGDGELMTRVNAAVGLARHDSLKGLPVFEELLRQAPGWKLDPGSVKTEEQGASYFERLLMLSNSLKALDQLHPQFDAATKARLVEELRTLVDSTQDSVLRTDALQLAAVLKQR